MQSENLNKNILDILFYVFLLLLGILLAFSINFLFLIFSLLVYSQLQNSISSKKRKKILLLFIKFDNH